jgi:hypothetical protein
MMGKMMDAMICSMKPEEKQKMMLKMMPIMMKEMNVRKMMPNMMTEMGKIITAYGVYGFLALVLKDEELKQLFADMMKKMIGKMPEMMAMMAPMMVEMMPKMMNVMMPMMSEMMQVMAEKMPDAMPKMLENNPEMKEKMPEMMAKMCPYCAENMYPIIPKEKRTDFVLNMISTISRQGSVDMSSEERKNFQIKAVEHMKLGLALDEQTGGKE